MLALRSLLITLFCLGTIGSGSAFASTQNADEVSAAVESFLYTKASVYPGTPSVSVQPPAIRQHQQCDELSVQPPAAQRMRSRMTVTVRCLAPESWSLHVQANVSVMGYYYVSNRRLNVGDVISLDDLSPREGDILRLAPSVVTDPSLIIGSMVGQRLNAGSIIKASALRDPQSVLRGQTVRTVARGHGFVVSSEGQTLQAGAPGSQIQVRVGSGNVITATVLDSHTVQVLM
ncbi:MAG TPA: flagellar basal body P-ring formation chaperone FlgA [Paenalcaligenes sp.]|nr:flagellar basal body P-ring formation chaperone FlgA [Paenalcaligenes sp.]